MALPRGLLLVVVAFGWPFCLMGSLFTPKLLDAYPIEGKRQVMLIYVRYGPHTMAGHLGLENYQSRGFILTTPKKLKTTPPEVVNASLLLWINLEEPNGFYHMFAMADEAAQWAYVRQQLRPRVAFTLCPYTAAWLNAMAPTPVRVPIVYPYPAHDAPPLLPPKARRFDIIFVGNRCRLPPPVAEAFERMRHFDYRWVGQPKEMRCTRLNITRTMNFHRARELVAQARVALVHNVLGTFPGRGPPAALRNHSAFEGTFRAWDCCAQRKASRMKRSGCLRRVTLPQIKERTVVAAATGTVMLVYKAPHPRVMEEVFEPEHYLYWSNASDFEAKLRDVLANYERYVPMALRAREHVLRHYTTERFVDRYLAPLARRIAAQGSGTAPAVANPALRPI
eukprot:EG_transcript_12504